MNHDLMYLDHAAATPLDERVLAAMQPYFADRFYNPASPYSQAVSVRRDYEAARERIASLLGVYPGELIMTAGATESINLVFQGVKGHVVTSTIEHDAVLRSAERCDHTWVASDHRGYIAAEAVRAALLPETQLVSIGLANNELGTIQPLSEIARVVESERTARHNSGNGTPLYFHTDASQGAGLLDLHVSRLGVDLMTVNAAKVYGPKQVGLLWANRTVRLAPYIVGGGQEMGLRSGTENVAGVIGFAEALALAEADREKENRRLRTLRNMLEMALVGAFPDAVISGHPRRRLPNFLHVSFPGLDAERLVYTLELRGVLVATGSACAANRGTRSHVLEAIGLAPKTADGSLRLTLGRLSNENNTRQAAEIIIEEVRREVVRTGRA